LFVIRISQKVVDGFEPEWEGRKTWKEDRKAGTGDKRRSKEKGHSAFYLTHFNHVTSTVLESFVY